MIRILTISSLLLAGAVSAFAATPDAIDQFVSGFATPTRLTGKIARWDAGVCPIVLGQQPDFVNYISQRVKAVAAQADAPVNNDAACTPNVEIIFTRMPQDLLNDIRDHHSDFLGYTENGDERKQMATVTRPLQAWYATQTVDHRGATRIDAARRPGEGVPLPCFTCTGRAVGPTEYLSDATFSSWNGSRINEGVHSSFHHVLIVADVNKLKGYEAGPLADYIAMLALTQIISLDVCQPLPSITTMMGKGCEAKTGKLSETDLAYLRGLYAMNPERLRFVSQKGSIADSMKQALAGH